MAISNPQEHQDKFTEEQLKAVDAIYVESTDSVNLKKAVRIGLITDETRAKILAALGPGHAEILRSSRDRILSDESSPAVLNAPTLSAKRRIALRLAFEKVYGKFLFEEEYRGLKDTDPKKGLNKKLETELGKVLKVEIDESTGIAGRSELMAARRRLMMTDAAEIAANIARIESEIRKMEKIVALFEKVKTAPGKGEDYTMIFKTIPRFLKLIIANKANYDPDFVTKCEQYQMDFAAFLLAKGLTKSKKSDVTAVPDFFTDLKTAHFDTFAGEVAAFAEENLPKLKTDLIKKEEELGMASFPAASEVLNEAFTITKPLTPEEVEAKFKEAKGLLDSVTAPASPTHVSGEVDKAKKLLTKSSNKADLQKAIEILQNIHGFFDDKKEQDKIGVIIDSLEQIAGISPEVLIERATTKKEEAETRVQKAKSVKEYFGKHKATDISGKDDGLVKMTLKGGSKIQIKNANETPVDIDGVNFAETIVELTSYAESQAAIQSNNQDKLADAPTRKDKAGKNKAAAKKAIDAITKLQSQAKEFHTFLLEFAENAAFLAKNGFLDASYKVDDIEKLASELKGLDPMVANVSVKDLHAKYTELDSGHWLKIFNNKSLGKKFSTKIAEYNQGVKDADKDLKKKTDNLHAVHDLSDTAAAKRIILAVVKRQHPKLSLEDQHDLADLVLSDDVEKIQTQKSYEELAKEGSEDLENLVRNASEHDFKWKVLKFKYQVDGKVFEPFKDLKPAELNNWSKVEKQFTAAGKFDYQSGFYFLAAIKDFFGENLGSFTIVHKNLEKKLKTLIAERIGVPKRMGDSYVRRLVDEAFDKQLKSSRELMSAHFDNYDKNRRDIGKAKVKELKHKLKELNEKRKLNKIDQERYEEKYKDILKEAREYGIDRELNFCQDAELNGYLNSPEAQWVKDLGVDVGRYAKDKAWALTKGTASTGLNAAVGTVKAGWSLAFQGALTPLRLVKYPVFLAVKPIAGFINLFRTNKLNTPKIMATARQDIGRVGNYFKTMGKESFEGAKAKTAQAYSKPWSEAQFKRVPYAERTKVKLDDEAARIKELSEKSDLKPIEIAGAPEIDFDAIRSKIEENDKSSGGKSTLEKASSGEVKNKGATPDKKGPEASSETAEAS